MKFRRGLVLTSCAGLVLLAGMLAPRSAAAYCRTMGCSKDKPELACTFDGNGCLDNGLPLFWASSCISFGVQKDGSRADGIDYDAARHVIEQSFQTWLSADCGGGLPSISVENYGAIDCNRLEYNRNDGNANV